MTTPMPRGSDPSGAVVVDTSAMMAVLRGDRGARWITDALGQATGRFVSAPTALEFGIVSEARSPAAVNIARQFLRDAEIEIVEFDAELFERAMDGWRRFGKGRHAAALNFGDCCTYALASHLTLPILCTGYDFTQTDVAVHTPPTPL